jgi:ELWxxDGT repeat protein
LSQNGLRDLERLRASSRCIAIEEIEHPPIRWVSSAGATTPVRHADSSTDRSFSMHRNTLVLAMRAAGLAALASASIAPAAMAAPTASFFKTLATGTQSSDSEGGRDITATPNATFFTARDATHGQELWIAPNGGTPHLLTDLAPGSDSSNPRYVTAVGSKVYFRAGDGEGGDHLYVTDGTAAGTQLVPGNQPSQIYDVAATGDTITFVSGQRLYRVSPTTGEVEQVADFGTLGEDGENIERVWPGTDGGLLVTSWEYADESATYHLVRVDADGSLHPVQFDDGDGPRPYVTHSPDGFAKLGSDFYFSTADGAAAVTDGTDEGTSTLSFGGDPLSVPNYTQFLDSGDGTVVFRSGSAVYRAHGTTVTKVGTLGNDSFDSYSATLVGGKLFYNSNGDLRVNALSGPTSASTLVAAGQNATYLTAGASALYFFSYNNNATTLYRTDGGAPVALTSPSQFLTRNSNLGDLTVTPSGSVLFTGTTRAFGNEVFVAPTTAGQDATVLVDANTLPNEGYMQTSDGEGTTFGHGKALFDVYDGFATQPWISDGSVAGTHALLPASNEDRRVSGATPVGDRAVFALQDNAAESTDLWITDDTAAGAHRFANDTSTFTVAGSSIYYTDSDGVLRKSDGSDAGTVVAKPEGAPDAWYIYGLQTAGSHVFLTAQDSDGTNEWTGVWSLDTATGAWAHVLDRDAGNFEFRYAATAGDKIYLPSSADWGPKVIWSSDGTTSGTHQLNLEDDPADDRNYNGQVFVSGSNVFAVAQAESTPYPQGHLWKIDDSAHSDDPSHKDGVRVASTADLDTDHLSPYGTFTPGPGGAIYQLASNKLTKVAGDGTVSTLRTFADGPNNYSSLYGAPTIDGKLYFTGYDADHGYEPWTTDGTAAGTAMLADVTPGAESSYAGEFIPAGNKLLFNASSDALGSQLFAYGEPDPVAPVATTPAKDDPAPVKGDDAPAAAPAQAVTPTPAPAAVPAPVDTRAVPRKVETTIEPLKETKKAYRFDVAGSVLGAKGLANRKQCVGQVEVVVTATTTKGKGKNAKKVVKTIATIKTKLEWVDGECTYGKVLSIAKKDVPEGAKLQATVTFRGNKDQQPKTGKPITLRVD